MSADRFSSDTDAHQLHELRKARHLYVVQPSRKAVEVLQNESSELDLAEPPPTPQWMRPVPRTARHSTPLITYQRQHYTLRRWCDRVPGLKYVARVVV